MLTRDGRIPSPSFVLKNCFIEMKKYIKRHSLLDKERFVTRRLVHFPSLLTRAIKTMCMVWQRHYTNNVMCIKENVISLVHNKIYFSSLSLLMELRLRSTTNQIGWQA